MRLGQAGWDASIIWRFMYDTRGFGELSRYLYLVSACWRLHTVHQIKPIIRNVLSLAVQSEQGYVGRIDIQLGISLIFVLLMFSATLT
jgi:hypothetical protein